MEAGRSQSLIPDLLPPAPLFLKQHGTTLDHPEMYSCHPPTFTRLAQLKNTINSLAFVATRAEYPPEIILSQLITGRHIIFFRFNGRYKTPYPCYFIPRQAHVHYNVFQCGPHLYQTKKKKKIRHLEERYLRNLFSLA